MIVVNRFSHINHWYIIWDSVNIFENETLSLSNYEIRKKFIFSFIRIMWMPLDIYFSHALEFFFLQRFQFIEIRKVNENCSLDPDPRHFIILSIYGKCESWVVRIFVRWISGGPGVRIKAMTWCSRSNWIWRMGNVSRLTNRLCSINISFLFGKFNFFFYRHLALIKKWNNLLTQ